MNRCIRVMLSFGALMCFLMACKPSPTAELVVANKSLLDRPVVLTVNEAVIEMPAVSKVVQRIASTVDVEQGDMRTRVLLVGVDYLVNQEVWRQAFVAAGSPVSQMEVQAEMDRFASALPRRELLADALTEAGMTHDEFRDDTQLNLYRTRELSRLNDMVLPPTDDEVEAYYAEHIDTKIRPESVDARQIVISTRSLGRESKEDRAAEALQRLKDGELFDDVAWMYSDHASRSEGGRIGRVWRELTQNKRLENVLFSVKEGSFSEIFKDGEDFYIFKVDKHYPSREYGEDELRERIREVLQDAGQRKIQREHILQLFRDADIQFMGNLKPLEEVFWKIFYPEIADEKLGVEPPEPTAEAEAP